MYKRQICLLFLTAVLCSSAQLTITMTLRCTHPKTATPSKRHGQMSSGTNKFLSNPGDSGILFKGAESPSFCIQDKFDSAAKHINEAQKYIEEPQKSTIKAQKAIHELLLAQYALRDIINSSDMPRTERMRLESQSVPDSLCSVAQINNGILQISYPFLLGTYSNSDSNDSSATFIEKSIGVMTRNKLDLFLYDHPNLAFPDGFLYLIFKRFIPQNGNKLLVCDSNNMETGAITNAVSQAIGRSDNAYSMGFVYTASVDEYPHTEVTLIQASDLPEWHRYMGT